jgi:hypothetical protein
MKRKSNSAEVTSQIEGLPEINRHNLNLSDIKLNVTRIHNDDTGKLAYNSRNSYSMELGGNTHKVSNRFLHSLCGQLGQSESVFTIFEPEEVIERAKERKSLSDVVVTSALNSRGEHEALAVTSTEKARAEMDIVKDYISEANKNERIQKVEFNDGKIIIDQFPADSVPEIEVYGDVLNFRDTIQIPVDGWGNPNSFTGFLRLVCSNGMTAMTKMMESTYNIGKGDQSGADCTNALLRSLNNMDLEKNYVKIQELMNTAGKTNVSLREFNNIWKTVQKAKKDILVYDRFTDWCKDAINEYGLVNLDEVDSNTLRGVPVKGLSVYDMMNVCTEISTHHAKYNGQRNALQMEATKLLFSGNSVRRFDLQDVSECKHAPKPTHFEETDHLIAMAG